MISESPDDSIWLEITLALTLEQHAPEGNPHGQESEENEPRNAQAQGGKAQEAERFEPVAEGQCHRAEGLGCGDKLII